MDEPKAVRTSRFASLGFTVMADCYAPLARSSSVLFADNSDDDLEI
jgi:hypothetical protein